MATFVDIGNTNVKMLGQTIKTAEFDISKFFDHDNFVISSVVPKVLEVSIERLRKFDKKFMIIDSNSDFSFERNINLIGTDLLLITEGAVTLSEAPLCVITVGTAIVPIFVSLKNGKPFYEGGVIMPGFGLQTEILNERTAQLPKVELKAPTSYVATNAKDAINAGVCFSIIKGVEAIVKGAEVELGVKFNKIFVTGGDGLFLKNNSALKVEYVDDLVFRGMKSVYSRKGEIK